MEAFERLNPPVVAEAAGIHPGTRQAGKPALYVDDRVGTFAGMSDAQSKPIVGLLCEPSVQLRFVYGHCRVEPGVMVRTQPTEAAAIRQQSWKKEPAKLEGTTFATAGGVSSSIL